MISLPPGRRWTVLHYLPQHDQIGELHRLSGLGSSTGTVDPRYEYRWVYDRQRQLWRVDVRVHADTDASSSPETT